MRSTFRQQNRSAPNRAGPVGSVDPGETAQAWPACRRPGYRESTGRGTVGCGIGLGIGGFGRIGLLAWAAGLTLTLVVVPLGGVLQAASGTYRYGGYTPIRAHAGEWAEIDAPRCHVTLHRRGDHDAAYVDVSNSAATAWGQAGWWLGTSGSGVYYGAPVAYAEYRTMDGTYRWIPLGTPPAYARYVVYRTPLTVRDDDDQVRYLYRIETSFVAGAVATYPYPAATGWNAGLAESYSAPGVEEPIGPTAYRDLQLLTGSGYGRFKLWVPAIDGATSSNAQGDRLSLAQRYHAWSVEGHLYYGPSGLFSALRDRLSTLLPAGAAGHVFAPLALHEALHGTAIETLGVDRAQRLFGAAMRPDGRLMLFRWSVPRPGGPAVLPPTLWTVPSASGFLGRGEGVTALALPDGTDLLVGGLGGVVLPRSSGKVRLFGLPGSQPIVGAAAGPEAGTIAVTRQGLAALDVVRLPYARSEAPWLQVRVRRVPLPAAVGQLGALVASGPDGFLAIRQSAHLRPRTGDRYDASLVRLTHVDLTGQERGSGAAKDTPPRPVAVVIPVPARFLVGDGRHAYVSGGDRASGVQALRLRAGVRSGSARDQALGEAAGLTITRMRALRRVGYWDDPVALSPDGTVWVTVHASSGDTPAGAMPPGPVGPQSRDGHGAGAQRGAPPPLPTARAPVLGPGPPARTAASSWEWVADRGPGRSLLRWTLPPVYAAPGGRGAGMAVRPVAHSLVAGKGFAVLVPDGTDTVWIAYEP